MIWIITNQKTPQRKGKVQLINAADFHVAMIQSLGSKRKEISDGQIEEITQLFGDFEDVRDRVKIFDNVDFGYQRITIERPLKRNFQVCEDRIEILKSARSFTRLPHEQQQRVLEVLATLEGDCQYKNRDAFIGILTDAFTGAQVNITTAQLKLIYQSLSEYDETADVCTNRKGETEPDPDLRDYENVPLREDIDAYFEREILPHVPEAWIDYSKTKVGYEIPFNRYFYVFDPPRALDEIGADLIGVTDGIVEMIEGMTDGIVETVGGLLNG